jgi:DNA polymerase-3 subunit chi
VTKAGFYHLTRSPLEQALPRLLERARAAGHKIVVMTGSAERTAAIDNLLWTFDPASWLPHGTPRDGDAPLQPILITEADENPNAADLLVLLDGVTSTHIDGFARCAVVFDGNDEQAVTGARALWAEWKDKGFALAYHQQTERGGWEEKASANVP